MDEMTEKQQKDLIKLIARLKKLPLRKREIILAALRGAVLVSEDDSK